MLFNKIVNTIRITCIKHLLLPVLSLIAALSLYYIIPFNEVFYPETVHSATLAMDAYNDGAEYITINFDNVYYTGYDIMSGDKTVASYYYSLVNDKCTFILLSSSVVPDKPEKITNASYKVKFMETDGVFDSMLSSFSQSINWTYESISSITTPVIFDQTEFNIYKYIIFYILIAIVILYSCIYILANLLFIFIPFVHPSLLHVFYLSNRRHLIHSFKDLLEDFNNNIIFQTKDMYITNNYFINLGSNEVSILPLKDIVFGYEHGRLRSLFGIHIKITHNLYFRGNSYFKIEASKKSATDISSIIDYIKKNYPDIIWGYTKQNRMVSKEIILRNIKENK